VEGYRSVLKRVHSRQAYQECGKLYLWRAHARPGEGTARQRWLRGSRGLFSQVMTGRLFMRLACCRYLIKTIGAQ
jgi:hypothetical protein